MSGEEITIRSGVEGKLLYLAEGTHCHLYYDVYESFYPKPVECGFFGGKKYPKGKIALNQLVSITKRFDEEYSPKSGDCAKIFAKLVEMEFPTVSSYTLLGGRVKVELSDGKVYELFDIRKHYRGYQLYISGTIAQIMSDRKYQLAYIPTHSKIEYKIKPYLIPADFKADVDEFNVMHAKFMEIARKNDEAQEELRRKQLEREENEIKRIASMTASQAEELFRNL